MADEKQPKAPRVKRPKKPRRRGALKSWFTNPMKRARLIIWTGVAVMGLVAFVIVALGVTSSYWFCANGCHMVQDDTVISYNRSSHNKVSCLACHMPVNADPVTFMLHKMNGLVELYMVVSGQASLPLNPESEVAKTMSSAQCTQCHSDNRQYTPSSGIIIDHAAHAKNGITCPTCHNRVAHSEDFKLTLAGNKKHEDWMKMEACFRCHSLNPNKKGLNGYNAPGKCSTCHPTSFQLKPANHLTVGFVNPGAVNTVKAASNTTSGSAEATVGGHPALYKEKGADYCYMCHDKATFCDACHGLPMPHTAEFKQTNHGTIASQPGMAAKCQRCHPGGADFCNGCHHPASTSAAAWIQEHPAVAKKDATPCLASCHKESFCSGCHVRATALGLIKP